VHANGGGIIFTDPLYGSHWYAGIRCRWVDLIRAAIAMMVQVEKWRVSEVGTWLPQLMKELD
jgi:hypothetical protein